MRPLLESATEPRQFLMPNNRGFDCFVGAVDHSRVIEALAGLKWAPSDHFAADLRWLGASAMNRSMTG